MRTFLPISVLILVTSCGSHDFASKLAKKPQAATLSFTELNLGWFGTNGQLKSPLGSETRAPTIRKFLQENNLLTDVITFEEILDLELLQNVVLDNQYQCHTYQHNNPRHQHIVLCHTEAYRFDVADDAENYALDSIDINGHLRPAVHGILKTQDGTRLAHIFGVHLKANPDKSDVRMEQVQNLVEYIKQENGQDPVVVLGDFNTFNADASNMQTVFKQATMSELDFPELYTWASATEHFDPAKLDRVWLSKGWLTGIHDADIKGPCSSGNPKLIREYNTLVSDHCATTFSVEL